MKNFIKKTLGFLAAAVMGLSAAVPVSAEYTRASLPENEAMSFVDSMGAGWNLGNGFDASNCTWLSNELDYESGWCGAKTTKELIKAVKDAGFGTVRIPVSWHNHVDKNYKISEAWMARVKEVADWCLDEGLKVIINIHHDNDKHDVAYYHPSAAMKDESVKYIRTVWQQISDTFKDYDNRLIFQGLNEPRLTGTEYEWWYNANDVPAEVKTALENINLYNQTFVDTVRASGGNNSDRFLLIVGYAGANNELGVLSPSYKLPSDKAKDRLIVDCHYYGIGERSSPAVIDKLYEAYTSKGIPVAITEYGLNENGYDYEGMLDTAVTRMGDFISYARSKGVSVVIWDNNAGGNGTKGFKFFDRATAKNVLPRLVKAITEAGAPAIKTAPVSAAEEKTDDSTAKAKVTKPSVKAVPYKNKVTLKWGKVDNAEKYAVYMYKDGKYKCLTSKLTKTSYTVSKLKSGTEYKFLVKAYVGGKWTKTTTKDVVKVKTK